MTPENAQVHCPTVVRRPVVLVRRVPAAVIEPNVRSSITRLELEADDRPRPVGVGARQPQLEPRLRLRFRHFRLPRIAWAEVQLVRRTDLRATARPQRPPLIQ